MLRLGKLLLMMINVLLVGAVISAQSECVTLVQQALAATDSACSDTARNQACYGNIQIQASLSDTTASFSQQGDKVDLSAVQSLTLSPYQEGTDAWGVALFQVQANLPDTVPGQNVTFLLFGDVQIANGGDNMEAFYFSSGVGASGCNDAGNGVLIQTPEGVGQITLTANNVTVSLGSTAFFTADPGDVMTVALFEGTGEVEFDDVTQPLEPNFQVSVPINEDLEAVGAPMEPEPIDEELTEIVTPFFETETLAIDDEEMVGGGGAVDVVPLNGDWLFELGTPIDRGCPAIIMNNITQAMNTNTVETVDWGDRDNFNFQQVVEASSDGPLPPGMVFDNPEPGVYTMTFEEAGVSVGYTMRIQSETEIVADMTMDMAMEGASCAFTLPFTFTYQG